MKQCTPNPWDEFASTAAKGDRVKGAIKSITDFGIFIGLPGGIDGLVHTSDLSWTDSGEDAVRNYKKGDEVEAVILLIDVERERISLGVKQLEDDPLGSVTANFEKGSILEGMVRSIDAKGLLIDLGDGVEGFIKTSDLSREKGVSAESFSEGQAVQAMVSSVDRKTRVVNLSIKAKDAAEEAAAIKKHSEESDSQNAGTTNLGALLKAKMENN
jgi:small subunit ribosomal protein S1